MGKPVIFETTFQKLYRREKQRQRRCSLLFKEANKSTICFACDDGRIARPAGGAKHREAIKSNFLGTIPRPARLQATQTTEGEKNV